MGKSAVFANLAITINLGSVTGLKYTTKYCLECGKPIIERNGNTFFRVTGDYPEEARINQHGFIPTACHECSQNYKIVVSQNISNNQGIPLYMQPQSLFLAVSSSKKLRDTHCLECGKAFFSVADRYDSVSDNTIPFEFLNPKKLGPMESRCDYHHCKQRWSIMT